MSWLCLRHLRFCFGRSVGPVGRSDSRSDSRSVGQSAGRTVGRSVGRSVSRSDAVDRSSVCDRERYVCINIFISMYRPPSDIDVQLEAIGSTRSGMCTRTHRAEKSRNFQLLTGRHQHRRTVGGINIQTLGKERQCSIFNEM